MTNNGSSPKRGEKWLSRDMPLWKFEDLIEEGLYIPKTSKFKDWNIKIFSNS